jgi:hypothetical protein
MSTHDPAHSYDSTQKADGIDDAAYTYALEQLSKGCRPADVGQCLVDAGHTESHADQIVQSALDSQHRDQDQIDISTGGGGTGWNGNMITGAIVCLLGIVITVGSFMAAQGGGTYFLAYGAIIWGAIQFFRGAAQKGQEMGQHSQDTTQRQDHRQSRL